MRLLEYRKPDSSSDAYTFSLIECQAHNLPPYAILSHRWGADEVTLRDIEDVTVDKKAGGHKKLQFCAVQAARDGLLYFWVDTCCIDKTSSAELSEAINSMYKWYEQATKCYVYLPDVSARREWEATFQQSEWFERGWTLQELIAPHVVEFFSVEGQKLGDKESLLKHLQQITGISIEALQGKSPSKISEQERFSWTVGRRTTVDEDVVYCLLGIFGVHMPLIYGEGQQKARARLRREIQLQTRSEEVREVADWYSNTDFAEQQSDQLSRRQKGTGGWFLAHTQYQQWRQMPNSTLLCPGIPGSGKSVMVATVVDDLQTYFQVRNDVVIAYLYCNFNRQAEQSLGRILATLTRQLFQERAQLPDTVKELYKTHRERATRPSVDELRHVLQSLLGLYSQVFVVIDALDECESGVRSDLLDDLAAIQDSRGRTINVLVTTRFIPDTLQRFSQQPRIEIRASQSDVEMYLSSQMPKLAKCVLRNNQLQDAIKQHIVNAAEGMLVFGSSFRASTLR